jgi:hypothetical protein
MPAKIFEYVNPEVDHYSTVDRKTGLRTARSVAATEDEIRQRDADAYRRSLDGVEFRLAHVDEAQAWYEDPPSEQRIAERRALLENEKQFILAKINELHQLGADTPPARKRQPTSRRSARD